MSLCSADASTSDGSNLLDKATDGKLHSLLKYLDEIDFENTNGKCRTSSVPQDLLEDFKDENQIVTTPQNKDNDSHKDRRWIWDDICIEDTVEGENMKSELSEKPKIEHALNSKNLIQASDQNSSKRKAQNDDYNETIKRMQSDLNKRSAEVESLQACLIRKRLSCERSLKLLNTRWLDRIEKQTNIHTKVNSINIDSSFLSSFPSFLVCPLFYNYIRQSKVKKSYFTNLKRIAMH